MAAKKKASGRNISEAERNTEAVKARIHPLIAEALRASLDDDETMSDFIGHAIVNRLSLVQSHAAHLRMLLAIGYIDQEEADRRTAEWKKKNARDYGRNAS